MGRYKSGEELPRLRIALTVDPELPVPPVHYGGIERIVDMLARGLANRGHEVTLFSSPQSTCPVTRIAWPCRSSSGRGNTLRNALMLSRHVVFGQFDLVHSFSRIAYMAPFLPLSVPKLMSYQREVSPKTTAAALRLSRGTLQFSAISRRMIEARPLPGRWHMIPNGVPLETYAFRAEVAPDAPLIFLGRIEEIKGPHLAVEIARRSGRRLIIAGNVPAEHQSWFEANVAPHIDGDRIRYLGPLDDAQKNKLLGEAAAFLMPILWEEPFGIVMAEAMACGTPVLGLRRGAVPEVVEHGVTGFVVETIEEMIEMTGRLGALSRAATRERVERFYCGEAVTNGYLRAYADILHGAAAADWPERR